MAGLASQTVSKPAEGSYKHLCVLSALASLGLPTSPWVVGALKGRLRVSAQKNHDLRNKPHR